jgi:osmotically-inducible protein OsmY
MTSKSRLLSASLAVLGALSSRVLAAPPELNDSALWGSVQQRLIDEGDAPTDTITVQVESGIVVLSGLVEKPLARRWFGELAGSVPGIRGVVNQITVDPAARPDSDIQSGIRSAVGSDPATALQPIKIYSVDGDVTLGGTVTSRAEKDLAALAALSIAGVNHVNNDIGVSAGAARPDSEIANDIREEFRWDAWLCDVLPNVEVERGVVTLTGSAPSAFARRRAAELANVDGVTAVEDHIIVVPPSQDAAAVSPPNPANRLKADAQAAFAQDTRLKGFDPHIAVAGLSLELSGDAPSVAVKTAAAEDADSFAGEGNVRDSMTVSPAARPNDQALAGSIHDALAHDPLISVDDITVTVDAGHVLIRGAVSEPAQRGFAEAIAKRVAGVIAVTDELTVLESNPGRMASAPPARR